MTDSYDIQPVGVVRSPLKRRQDCPHQSGPEAPDTWIEIDPRFAEALDGLAAGSEVVILTWLHKGRRNVLKVHPRRDPEAPLRGVFATRSPDRPNPIGLHRVRIKEIVGRTRLRVSGLEVLDGTPVADIKPVSSGADDT